MKYTKKIECDSSSIVMADVIDENGNNYGHQFYMYNFFTGNSNKALKKRFERANKWADERIKTLIEKDKK